jgi:hypothetical protein
MSQEAQIPFHYIKPCHSTHVSLSSKFFLQSMHCFTSPLHPRRLSLRLHTFFVTLSHTETAGRRTSDHRPHLHVAGTSFLSLSLALSHSHINKEKQINKERSPATYQQRETNQKPSLKSQPQTNFKSIMENITCNSNLYIKLTERKKNNNNKKSSSRRANN